MHFLCCGKCKKVFEILYQGIAEGGDSFSFYEDGLSLINKAMIEKSESGLIFMDYDLYKGFVNLIYDVLNSKNLKIPVILIGDPKRDVTERMNYWVSINEFKYGIQTLHLQAPLFKRISEALESPEIKELIFKGERTEHISSAIAREPVKSNRKNLLISFRKKTILPPSIYNLLAFLYKNRCREVSVDEIAAYMKIGTKTEKSRRNAVYAYIARLRKCIGTNPTCSVEVLRTRTGYYKLFLH